MKHSSQYVHSELVLPAGMYQVRESLTPRGPGQGRMEAILVIGYEYLRVTVCCFLLSSQKILLFFYFMLLCHSVN